MATTTRFSPSHLSPHRSPAAPKLLFGRAALVENPIAPAPQSPIKVPFQSGVTPSWVSGPMLTQTFTSPAGYPLTRYTLPNGHRIFIEQRPSDFVGVRTLVNSGSIIENPVKPSALYPQTGLPSGIAHLDEHDHFLQTQNYPEKNSLTSAMNQLGASWNASTSSEIIQHELFFNREDLSQALKLHAESVLRPLYTAQDLPQEKANVLNEAALRSRTPEIKLFNKVYELMFDRLASQQVLGTPEDIKATTPEQLQQFHNLAYAPTNLVTVVSGNVKPEDVLATLAPDFGNNPPRNTQLGVSAMQNALHPNEIRSATMQDPQLTNSQVFLAFPAPAVNNYKDRMALSFLNELLSGGETNLLNHNLVNEKNLASSVDTFRETQKQASVFGIHLETRPGQEQNATTAALEQVAGVAQGWIPEEKFANIRQNIIHRFETAQESTRATTMQLGEAELNNTLPYYLHYAQIANLITPEDVRSVAERYVNPKSYAVVYGLPAAPPSAGKGVPQ